MRRRLLSLLLVFVLVLGMVPVSAAAADVPFTVTADGAEITAITESTLSNWNDLTCYTVTVPEGTTEVTLQFEEDMQCCYYTAEGDFLGYLSGYDMNTSDTHIVAVQDKYGPPDENWDTSTPDGVLDGVSVQYPDTWTAAYFVQFAYGSGESGEPEVSGPTDPFLTIQLGGQDIAKENIAYKGIFKLGDYMADEEQEVEDYYDYVHEVPYYHVTVPCGTASVDVTYSGDTNIMNSGSNAYGYKTDLEVDAMSSATVRGMTFSNAYTKNADGTQTVKTPVTGNTFGSDGNGHAVTLEEDGGSFAAVCLFSFEYDGKNHVYDSGKVTTQPGCETEGIKTYTCSCGDSYTETLEATGHSFAEGTCENCGEADPGYVAPGAEIPAGTNILSITDVTEFAEGEEITFSLWGMEMGPVPSYVATVPEGTKSVTLTFQPGSYPEPYDDWYTGELSLSGAWVTYDESEYVYTGSGTSHSPIAAEDTHAIELDVEDLIANGRYYCAYDSGNNPMYLLGFKYPEGAHEHNYGEGVVTTQPGCVSLGEKTFTCSCGDSYTEPVDALGHLYDAGVETTPATCVTDGEKTFTCSRCTDDVAGHTKTESINKLGHSYDAGVVTTAPTCTEDGLKTYTCTRCESGVEGHTKTETVTSPGHNYQNGKCENCGEICPVQDENGVYQLATTEELLWFAKAVNGGDTGISGVLTADITLDSSWPGIGTSGSKFAGSFDGQNHTVTLSGSTWGLFGYTLGTYDSNGNTKQVVTIQNVITAGSAANTALIHNAGYTHIFNCINKADVTGGNGRVAGIVGSVGGYSKAGILYSDIRIENCGNEGSITGGQYTAGIVGFTQTGTKIINSYNAGTITGTNTVGGIAGYFQGAKQPVSIDGCYNTGTVSGSSQAGGLVGILYNGATLQNSYNAGQTQYGIIGAAYSNKYGTIKNSYYLASASTMGIPASCSGSYEYAARTMAEMNDEAFIEAIGGGFQLSCPTPVLSWQTPVEHTGTGDEDGCDVCGFGSSVKQAFQVTFVQDTGYTISGDETATEGEPYTFTVTLADGYRRQNSFAVKVNGTAVEESSEVPGTFTYEDVQGPLNITVQGVEKIPEFFTVTLPNGEGNGYRLTSVSGTNTVPYGGDYQFRVTMQENFREGKDFQVLVNGSEAITADAEGIYSIPNVLENKTVTVTGVEAKPYGDTVSVTMNVTKGENTLYETPQTGSDQMMLLMEMDVPYFDIGLYGLGCYYNPDCYRLDEDGKRLPQTAGNSEIAYGKITVLHALIYATEVHYLGLDENLAGTGLTYQDGSFQKAFRLTTAAAGSIFMNLWDHGTNLNYYVNYKYPLGLPGWGSTSDQILLSDGDIISAHMIASGETDENGDYVQGSDGANGSAFGVFVVEDDDSTFEYGKDTIHQCTVTQGEEVKLSLYSSMATSTYDTDYSRLGNQQLYWIHDDDLVANLDQWNTDDTLKTDSNGDYVLDTSAFEPGIYYIGAKGGFTKGDGKPDAGGFVSNGYERGPAILILTVTEGSADVEYASGDVNGDGYITADDAAAAYAASMSSEGLTEEQLTAADVNGDGYITADDAAKIYEMSKGGVE